MRSVRRDERLSDTWRNDSVLFQQALDELEAKVDLDKELAACVRFMLEAVSLFPLSKVAGESLIVARRWLDGDVPASEFESYRVACWLSIEGRDCDTRDQEVAATRAVICLLFPPESWDDAYGVIDTFADFAISAGASSEKMVEILASTFDGAA